MLNHRGAGGKEGKWAGWQTCGVSGGLVPILGLRETLQLVQPQFPSAKWVWSKSPLLGLGDPVMNGAWHEGSDAYA